MTNQVSTAQRKRSLAIAWGLAAMVALFFVVTLVQLTGNMAKRAELNAKLATGQAGTEANGGQ